VDPKLMKKYIPFIMLSPLLLSLSACNEQTASNPIKQEKVEDKQQVPEIAPQDNQTKNINNAPKSAQQLWQESQQLSKDVWETSKKSGEQLLDKSKSSSNDILQKSAKTTDELWQSSKENSQDIWIETKESSAEVWDDVKDAGQQIWLDGNKALETLIKTKEQATGSEKKTETTIQLADDET
jgi:hypothetical protein